MYFTEDWFSKRIPVWDNLLKKFKSKPVTFIEVGCFEGRCSVYLLKNILKHDKSKLICIDHFLQKNNKNEDTYPIFLKNVENYKHKIHLMKGFSFDMLKKINEPIDFVYIDASRHSKNVLEDMIMSWNLLKSNGYMIVDDYTNNKEHDNNCPKKAIDCFTDIYFNELQILETKWQIIIKKRTLNKFLPKKPCYSELMSEPKDTPIFFDSIY